MAFTKYVIRENIETRQKLVEGMAPYHQIVFDNKEEAIQTAKEIKKEGLYVTASEYADEANYSKDFTITESIVWASWFDGCMNEPVEEVDETEEEADTTEVVEVKEAKTETVKTEEETNMENTANVTAEITDEEVLEMIKEEMDYDFDSLKRYDKRSLPWSVKQLVASMKKGTARFDNSVQRTLVWDNAKKSRLIHSVILGLPIPPLYANVYTDAETGKKVYDFLDGKQRSHAFKEFLEDGFELVGVPVLTFSDGKEFDINGYKFHQLPEELQDIIKGYMLNISTLEDLNEDEVTDLFYVLNNGVALTAIEISRVKAKNLEAIQRIANHDLFKVALTDKARAKYTDEDIVIKSIATLFEGGDEGVSLETKFIRPYMETLELDEDDINGFTRIFDRIYAIYTALCAEGKDGKRYAKKMTTRTHLVSLVPIIHLSMKEDKTVEEMVEWIKSFFSLGRCATVDDEYNANSASGANRKYAVMRRNQCMMRSYNGFFH